MKRSLIVLVATLAMVLGVSASALAATPDPHASCVGLVAASHAGEPGAQAEFMAATILVAKFAGLPPGLGISNFANSHEETAEVCLD